MKNKTIYFALPALSLLIAVIVAVMYETLNMKMAHVVLSTGVFLFIAAFFVGRRDEEGLHLRAILLGGPYFLLAFALVFIQLASIFYVLPLVALISVYLGFYAKAQAGGIVRVLPFVVVWGVLTAAGFYVTRPEFQKQELSAELLENAPAFSLQTLEGEPISSEDFTGKVTLLDFWATWCGPCRVQFPELQQIYEKYADRSDFAFLAVNTSWSDDTIEKAKRFLAQNPYTFPVAYDDGGGVTQSMDIAGLPHTILIDKNGKIRMRHTGILKNKGELFQGLSQRIDELIAE